MMPQTPPASLQHVIDRRCETHQRQKRSDVVALVQRVHGVFLFLAVHNADTDNAGN